MIGSFQVKVSRKRGTSFKFTIRRNITVVRGDSGTGKTTLYDMVADYTRLGASSGVSIQCEKPCVALTDVDWRNQLSNISDSIVFIDEGLAEVASDDFSRIFFESGNYCVIFSRAELPNLPYSVDEVYRIKTSGKYHSFAPMYKRGEGYRYSLSRRKPKGNFDVVLTEDSKAGFEFYRAHFASDSSIRCETALNNSGVATWIANHKDEKVFVVADGAAFGPYADRLLKLQNAVPDSVAVALPESFEWLILKSGLIKADGLNDILEQPGLFIDSREFGSWEQFFTSYLKEVTAYGPFKYDKGKLSEAYEVLSNSSKVVALIACNNVR